MKETTEPAALPYRSNIAIDSGPDLRFGEAALIQNLCGVSEIDLQFGKMSLCLAKILSGCEISSL
jgi:hypothetical protein